jgi:hypothetical protein
LTTTDLLFAELVYFDRVATLWVIIRIDTIFHLRRIENCHQLNIEVIITTGSYTSLVKGVITSEGGKISDVGVIGVSLMDIVRVGALVVIVGFFVVVVAAGRLNTKNMGPFPR